MKKKFATVLIFISFSLITCGQSEKGKIKNEPVFPEFDTHVTPFSYKGSRLVIEKREDNKSHRVFIRTLRYAAGTSNYYEVALFKNGSEITYETKAKPWEMELIAKEGNAQIVFLDVNTILFKSQNLSIRLVPLIRAAWIHNISDNEIRVMPTVQMHHHFKSAKGQTLSTGENKYVEGRGASYRTFDQLTCTSKDGTNVFAFREEPVEQFWNEDLPDFNETVVLRNREFSQWMDKMHVVPDKYKNTAGFAWFILWNLQVTPAGYIKRDALLSGKSSWYTQKWNWDDCIQSLALAHADLNFAFQQFKVIYDNQATNGCLPDAYNDLHIRWGFKKPPTFAWAIDILIKDYGWDACLPHLKELYAPMCRGIEYWTTYCDLDKNGMASYHHGNDSGWDNATIFDQESPVEGVDLAAFIYINEKFLSEVAEKIDKPGDSKKWQLAAEKQLATLLNTCVVNNHFVSKSEKSGKYEPSQSLINYLPVYLGNKLPKDILQALITDLKPGKGFLTANGIASENLNSPKYQAEGYWRGPVWAAPNYMIFKTLLDLGEIQHARIIAERYCNNMNNNPQFSENCDAITGKSYGAPGNAWTASAYILMANWLKENE